MHLDDGERFSCPEVHWTKLPRELGLLVVSRVRDEELVERLELALESQTRSQRRELHGEIMDPGQGPICGTKN
jgi:hypothetical protein